MASAVSDVWPDLPGRLREGTHVLPIRVYFEDTDFSGLVYHASYFRWCERGRSDYLRHLGLHHAALAAGEGTGEPCAFAVKRIASDFKKPARIDDVLEVVTRADTATRVSITMRQSVLRSDAMLFQATVQCVLVSLTGRLLRLPPQLTEVLAV